MNTDNNNNLPLTDNTSVSKKEKALILTLLIVIIILAAAAIFGFLCIKQQPDTIQGQADATEIRISGKLIGRIDDIYVHEGDTVRQGDTLVHIHSSIMDAKRQQADAMENVAAAANRKVDAGTRSQIINGAHDLLQQATAAKEIAEKTYTRMENLYAKGVVSAQKRDEAKAAYDAAAAGQRAAQSQYELAKAGAQKEDRQAAASMVSAAKGTVKEVDAFLEDQYLIAPCDGIVTVIYPEVSELVAAAAPIMTIQKDDRWAVFNVRETALKNIKNGTKIKVYIPALDKKTTMTVYYIKDMGSYANWQPTKATGSYDARTFQFKARPDEKIDNFLPGMSVVLLDPK